MRRIVLVLAVAAVAAAMLAFAGPALAADEPADTGCVGVYASSEAQVSRPFGETVSAEAEESHPLGQSLAKPLATECEFEG
jgi:hypothetical protein